MRLVPAVRTAAPALAGLALLAGGLLQQVPHAGAYAEWCFDDPVVLINGAPVHIDLGIQASATTIQASITAANIVVHVPLNVTTALVSSTTTNYPAYVTFKNDKGGTWTAGPVPIQVVTTFSLKAGAKALNAQEQVTTTAATAAAKATIQGSMNLDVAVPQ